MPVPMVIAALRADRKPRQKPALVAQLDEHRNSTPKDAGSSPVERSKKLISIRLDIDVLAKFRATGKGWQSRINEALRKAQI